MNCVDLVVAVVQWFDVARNIRSVPPVEPVSRSALAATRRSRKQRPDGALACVMTSCCARPLFPVCRPLLGARFLPHPS